MRPTSIETYFKHLRAFVGWCVDRGYLGDNPTHQMDAPVAGEVIKPIVTKDQVFATLDHLEKARNWRDGAIIAVLFSSGIRLRELIDLRRGDIDLKNFTATIHKGKNRDNRVVGISTEASTWLWRYLNTYEIEPHEPLWWGTRGPLREKGVWGAVRKAFKEAARVELSPHTLRHSWASALIQDEAADLQDVKTLGGWKTWSQIDRYTASLRTAKALDAHKRSSAFSRDQRRRTSPR